MTARLRLELVEVEAWQGAILSEFQQADGEMDTRQIHLQALRDQVRALEIHENP